MIHLLLVAVLTLGAKAPQQRIAFTAGDADNPHLFVMNLDGSGMRQITDGPNSDEDPCWSPDNSRIVFTRTTPDGYQGSLWTVRPDGSNLERLTYGPYDDRAREWTDDGSGVTFYRGGDHPADYTVKIATRQIARIVHKGWWFSESPTDDWIVYIHYLGGDNGEGADGDPADLWLTDDVNKTGRRLTSFKAEIGDPDWSPDGGKIAFTASRNAGGSLLVAAIPSGKIHTLVRSTTSALDDANWSPDGKRLAYVESRPDRRLWVVAASGAGRRCLTPKLGEDWGPQWTAGGKSIVVCGVRSPALGKTELILIDATGKGERIIPTGMLVNSFDLSR